MHQDVDLSAHDLCNTRQSPPKIEYHYRTEERQIREFSSLRPNNAKQTKIIAWNKYADKISIPDSICFVDFHDEEAIAFYTMQVPPVVNGGAKTMIRRRSQKKRPHKKITFYKFFS